MDDDDDDDGTMDKAGGGVNSTAVKQLVELEVELLLALRTGTAADWGCWVELTGINARLAGGGRLVVA